MAMRREWIGPRVGPSQKPIFSTKKSWRGMKLPANKPASRNRVTAIDLAIPRTSLIGMNPLQKEQGCILHCRMLVLVSLPCSGGHA